jgi:SAM-dependent methyltransferase
MREGQKDFYRSPATGASLTLHATLQNGDSVLEGEFLTADNGARFEIHDGIPDFTWPPILAEADSQTRASYEKMADEYDMYAPLPFQTYRADEEAVREHMVDLLEVKEDSRVLEIGCGTGRGAPHIASRLSAAGQLYLQELSSKLLAKAVEKLKAMTVPIEFSIANGSYLPFPDNSFDAAHHFGGINTFAEIPRCLSELARVVRPGGKVVVGDEGLGPWLKDTEFGKIMANSNPLLKCEVPLGSLPPTASEVRVEWILMGAFFVIDFRVAPAPPSPDYHLQIPSARGGSHWTRYFGQLEGVTDETKELAQEARRKSGLSMHEWLDGVVRKAANEELLRPSDD